MCVCARIFCTCFLIAMQVVGSCQVILDSQLLLGVVVPWQICVKSKHVSSDLSNLDNHLAMTCRDLFSSQSAFLSCASPWSGGASAISA